MTLSSSGTDVHLSCSPFPWAVVWVLKICTGCLRRARTRPHAHTKTHECERVRSTHRRLRIVRRRPSWAPWTVSIRDWFGTTSSLVPLHLSGPSPRSLHLSSCWHSIAERPLVETRRNAKYYGSYTLTLGARVETDAQKKSDFPYQSTRTQTRNKNGRRTLERGLGST